MYETLFDTTNKESLLYILLNHCNIKLKLACGRCRANAWFHEAHSY